MKFGILNEMCYVRKFMNIKMESSPLITCDVCKYQTEDEYKQIVKERLDINLGEIKHNPCMRVIVYV